MVKMRRRSSSSLLYFLLGFSTGCLALLLLNYAESVGDKITSLMELMGAGEDDDKSHGSDGTYFDGHTIEDTELELLSLGNEHEEDGLAMQLKKEVRVLCWIMSSPANTYTKAMAINATWGSRCNKHIFITVEESVKRSGLPTVDLGVPEGRNNLWLKTKAAFKYLYDHYRNDYDWFMKADDDTYVVVDNLRFMLLAHDPAQPIYLGCRFKPFVKQGYMSGGSGYILSKEALRRFVQDALPNPKLCRPGNAGAEDKEMGVCLAGVGVRAVDTRDAEGRHRMLPFGPTAHFMPDTPHGAEKHPLPNWFQRYMFSFYKQGSECCSHYMVSFHYVNRPMLFAIHHLIHHIRPFGMWPAQEYALMERMNSSDPGELMEAVRQMSIADSSDPHLK